MENKTVYHLVESYSPLSETFIYDLIENQEKKGIKYKVLAFSKNNEFRDVKNCIELKPNKGLGFYIKSLIYHLLGNREGFNYLRYALYQKSLYNHLKQEKPDVLHCHFATMGVIGVQEAVKLGVPTVCSFYGYDVSRNLKHKVWVDSYKRYFGRLDRAIGISNHICCKIENFVSKEKIELIHLPFKAELIKNTYPSQRLDNEVRCLFIGRLVDKKSPLELIQSFSKAKSLETENKLKLAIIGDGPLMEQSKELVEKLKLKDSITFKGSLPNDIVKKELEKSHLYLQHSVTAPDGDQEGQGVTLVEASALGLPVITTNHNGFTDVVLDGKTGYLVEEHDVEAMGKKIYELSRNVEEWEGLGTNGCQHISTNFNSETESDKVINLYNTL
jgi:colanic acid/amylovoran biosynthesis glycosyltransferase